MKTKPKPVMKVSLKNQIPSLKTFEVWFLKIIKIVNMKCIIARAKNHLEESYSFTHSTCLHISIYTICLLLSFYHNQNVQSMKKHGIL